MRSQWVLYRCLCFMACSTEAHSRRAVLGLTQVSECIRDLLLLQGFLQEGKPVQVAAFLMLLRAKVLP